jgi:ABC-type dipeptide/oligopeptide/nickel transport system ATPase component
LVSSDGAPQSGAASLPKLYGQADGPLVPAGRGRGIDIPASPEKERKRPTANIALHRTKPNGTAEDSHPYLVWKRRSKPCRSLRLAPASFLRQLSRRMSAAESPPLLEVERLSISFVKDGVAAPAVREVSFRLNKGKSLAVVGESGSGKSVTALALTRLLPSPPARYDAGRILLEGRDLLQLPERALRAVRGGRIGYVFQDPATSLNPVFTLRNQMAEVLRLHRPDAAKNSRAIDAEIVRWLDLVGIVDPGKRLHAYPHQFSGGMQQRAMIAMALCAQPDILVADEPTTALDVSIQAQIIDLLRDLKERLGMSILLITHNFGIIGGLADRVAVMFRGRLVESGETAAVLRAPQHPYTRALIDCIPRLGARRRRLETINYDALQEG